MTIGEFSRASGLSVSALHLHDSVGALVPAQVTHRHPGQRAFSFTTLTVCPASWMAVHRRSDHFSVTVLIAGLYEQVSAWGSIAALPVFAWEVSLAVWLIVKGFKPSPILRHVGVDAVSSAA